MDSLPFDADYDSDNELPPPFFDEDDSDDEYDGLTRGIL
jgi:hypothetical protein